MFYILFLKSYVLCIMYFALCLLSYVLWLICYVWCVMSFVLCVKSFVLFNTGWAFGPACFIVLRDDSCLMSVNLSFIQDTEDSHFMQPWTPLWKIPKLKLHPQQWIYWCNSKCCIISFLTMEYWNQTFPYFLGARGILHSTLPRDYRD